jgi:hypothetical protein
MFCVICQREIYDCICPDINERLAAIGNHPAFAMRWCDACNKHIDRCDCPDVGNVKKEVFRTGVSQNRGTVRNYHGE